MNALLLSRLLASTDLTALVDDRIFPTRPTGDTVLPYIVYTMTALESYPHLTGPGSLHRYEYLIDYWDIDVSPCLEVGAAIADALDGWREGDVQGSFRTGMSDELELAAYHQSQTYSIFGP